MEKRGRAGGADEDNVTVQKRDSNVMPEAANESDSAFGPLGKQWGIGCHRVAGRSSRNERIKWADVVRPVHVRRKLEYLAP